MEKKRGRILDVPQISAEDINGAVVQANYNVVPDECPICHRGIVPITTDQAYVSANTDERDWSGHLEICYRCPNANCRRMFVALYEQRVQVPHGERNRFFWLGIFPETVKPPDIPEPVRKLSPSFVKIYSQALAAEKKGLDEVCGPTLRRALEFLLKDYLIQNQVADEEAIKATALGTCIHNYVSDTNVKTCANRATWLGNDATHYERKYSTHDITHLKELITLTVYWLNSEIMTKKYGEDLTKK